MWRVGWIEVGVIGRLDIRRAKVFWKSANVDLRDEGDLDASKLDHVDVEIEDRASTTCWYDGEVGRRWGSDIEENENEDEDETDGSVEIRMQGKSVVELGSR